MSVGNTWNLLFQKKKKKSNKKIRQKHTYLRENLKWKKIMDKEKKIYYVDNEYNREFGYLKNIMNI